MSIRKNPKILVDSSVLIAAILSNRGGSFFILTQLADRYQFYINEYILQEILRVLSRKYPRDLDKRFMLLELLAIARVIVEPNPSSEQVAQYKIIVADPADAPILATAILECDYLLTLDNGFFEARVRDEATKAHLEIMKPRDFIQLIRDDLA